MLTRAHQSKITKQLMCIDIDNKSINKYRSVYIFKYELCQALLSIFDRDFCIKLNCNLNLQLISKSFEFIYALLGPKNTQFKPQFAQINAQSHCATPMLDIKQKKVTLSPYCNALCGMRHILFEIIQPSHLHLLSLSLSACAGKGNKNCLLFNFICSISDKQHVNLLELTQQQQQQKQQG